MCFDANAPLTTHAHVSREYARSAGNRSGTQSRVNGGGLVDMKFVGVSKSLKRIAGTVRLPPLLFINAYAFNAYAVIVYNRF